MIPMGFFQGLWNKFHRIFFLDVGGIVPNILFHLTGALRGLPGARRKETTAIFLFLNDFTGDT